MVGLADGDRAAALPAEPRRRCAGEPTPEALDEMHERFDILWSRVFMMGHGHVGESLLRYDGEHGSVAAIADYLKEIDPAGRARCARRRGDARRRSRRRLADFQQELREYTLRVMRADGAAGAQVRERIQSSARTTAVISLAAVLLSVLSLFLILRENRRQRQIAEMSRRSAEQAELASRAKSRFLTMMSHELRNPLNGVLGPLALLGQSDLAEPPAAAGRAGAAVRPVDAADAVGPARLRRDAGRALPAAAASPSASRRWPTRCARRCAPRAPGGARSACGRARRSGSTAISTGCGRSSCTSRVYVLEGRDPAAATLTLRPRRRQPRRRDRLRRRRRRRSTGSSTC